MSALTTYAVQRGEDATFVLYAPLATDLTGWGATAKLRKLAVGAHRLDPSAAVAATFDVTSFAGDAERGPGWNLKLTDTVSDGLDPGRYLADARITTAGGDAYTTRSWIVEIKEPATRAPA